ncbi:MAG: MFS transporter [Parachlamydiaceae bacterium]
MAAFIRYLILTFIGFANALPIPFTGSTLSVYLTESGYGKEWIGFAALLAIPFSLKLLWSPLIDHYPAPFCKNKNRKGWMLFAIAGMTTSLIAMGSFSPEASFTPLALSLFSLSLFTGCLYMTGLHYELESLDRTEYGMGSSFVHGGYRVGLLAAGALALYLAYLWNWPAMFFIMAAVLASGGLLVLSSPEPERSAQILAEKERQWKSYGSTWALVKEEVLLAPCRSFFQRSDWKAILLLILAFKVGDQLSKNMEGPFYLSLGFNKADLALASKVWGFGATLTGALIAGLFLKNRRALPAAALLGILHAATISLNIPLYYAGKSYPLLYLASALENFTSGLAMSGFIYMLWRVVDKRYAATQYALLWSVFSFKGHLVTFLGGQLAATLSWEFFFPLASITGAFCVAPLFLELPEKRVADQSTP